MCLGVVVVVLGRRLFKNVKIMLESKKDNIEKLCITLVSQTDT